ncbi:DnaT-like ssDNA-binding domain-containing protein [Oceanobacter sp. 3_MG-2023]|uniref:DnaT-like ssDNA-binding domain-containing protein n=1 Tax=Oceanobacter sp. 3_MG-2023 TaxID=3062622 RepID=UPI002732882C|nr:DnaT-like ssDNA-binding domain-containing protein [Oceanobacter sp. 3_MG-2023]MDP2505404.1 DnaT-like ssDNA-binding domain-containing protein [Oceanobacter sp. 3_MG-2023]
MQFSIYINQPRALEWGLNFPQAALFSFLYEAPCWAKPIAQGGEVWISVSKDKVMDELPLLTDKPDTIKRHMKALEAAGLIVRKTLFRGKDSIPLFRLTEKAKGWNRLDDHEASELCVDNCSDREKNTDRENNPALESDSVQSGKISPETDLGRDNNPAPPGKISPPPREKFPANQPTNIYPLTNYQHNNDIAAVRRDRSGVAMTDDWQPSPDTLARIQQAGVPQDFTLALVPEFRVFWLLAPDLPRSGSWDLSLLKHARSQWVKAQSQKGAEARAPKWQIEDFDWSSWSAQGDFNPDHVRHWLQVRRAACKVVTQELVDSVAQTLADAADDASVTFGMVAEDAMLAGWINIRYEWLVKRFEPSSGVINQ